MIWHRNPDNIEHSLNKYSVITLLYRVTEFILTHKPDLISKGFHKAGISPWDPSSPTQERMMPSEVYKNNLEPQSSLPPEMPPSATVVRAPAPNEENMEHARVDVQCLFPQSQPQQLDAVEEQPRPSSGISGAGPDLIKESTSTVQEIKEQETRVNDLYCELPKFTP